MAEELCALPPGIFIIWRLGQFLTGFQSCGKFLKSLVKVALVKIKVTDVVVTYRHIEAQFGILTLIERESFFSEGLAFAVRRQCGLKILIVARLVAGAIQIPALAPQRRDRSRRRRFGRLGIAEQFTDLSVDI